MTLRLKTHTANKSWLTTNHAFWKCWILLVRVSISIQCRNIFQKKLTSLTFAHKKYLYSCRGIHCIERPMDKRWRRVLACIFHHIPLDLWTHRAFQRPDLPCQGCRQRANDVGRQQVRQGHWSWGHSRGRIRYGQASRMRLYRDFCQDLR